MTTDPCRKSSLTWTIHHAHQLFHRRSTPSDFHYQLESPVYVFEGLHLRLHLWHSAEQHAFVYIATVGAGTSDLLCTPTYVTVTRRLPNAEIENEHRWIRWQPMPSVVEKFVERPQFFFNQRQLSCMIDRNTNTATFELCLKCQMPRSYATTPLHFMEMWQCQLISAWRAGTLYDVTLVLADSSSSVVRANKQILSAQSPVFQTMFQSMFKENNSKDAIVHVSEREVTVKALEAFVEYVSLGNLETVQKLTEWQDAFAVLRLCQFYSIVHVMRLSVLPTLLRLIRPLSVLPILSWLNLSSEKRELWGLELRSRLAEYVKHDPLLILDTACALGS